MMRSKKCESDPYNIELTDIDMSQPILKGLFATCAKKPDLISVV
jgi:hypothetical protein